MSYEIDGHVQGNKIHIEAHDKAEAIRKLRKVWFAEHDGTNSRDGVVLSRYTKRNGYETIASIHCGIHCHQEPK